MLSYFGLLSVTARFGIPRALYVDSPGGVFSHQSRVVVDSRSGTQPLHLSVLLLALHVSSG
jgi:hypothetical protein